MKDRAPDCATAWLKLGHALVVSHHVNIDIRHAPTNLLGDITRPPHQRLVATLDAVQAHLFEGGAVVSCGTTHSKPAVRWL